MTLLEEIQAKCTPQELAAKNYHVVAAKVNADRTPITTALMVSEKGIMKAYDGGPLAADAVLSKLEAFALTAHPLASITKRALKFLAQPEGLDIGDPSTQAMIDGLVTVAAITADEGTKLKALAPTVPNTVTWEQCQTAMGA